MQDPIWDNTNHKGCDVTDVACRFHGGADKSPFGFSPDGATAPSWLPQPDSWKTMTLEVQQEAAGSTYQPYREALKQRRANDCLGDGEFRWIDAPQGVLAFTRGDGFACFVNFGTEPFSLPDGAVVTLVSNELQGGKLPTDAAVWMSWITPAAR